MGRYESRGRSHGDEEKNHPTDNRRVGRTDAVQQARDDARTADRTKNT